MVEQNNLAKRFKLKGVPALAYYKNGKQIYFSYGIKSADKLVELEKKYFK